MKKKIKRRQYLVKKGMQLRFVGVVFLTTLLMILVMMYYMAWNVDKITELITRGGFSIEEGLAILKTPFLIKLGLVLFGMLLLNVTVSIIASHKVAGVIYRLEKVMDGISEGDIPSMIRIRRGDELNELVDKFNVMLVNLHSKVKDNRQVVGTLEEIIGEFKDCLKKESVSADELRVYIGRLSELKKTLEG
ncbi:MAG: methyl-accepting chemotaxis protein [bacterium]